MGCNECKFYEHRGRFRCVWFEVKISKIFPMWSEIFSRGELKFKKCGYFQEKIVQRIK